MIPKEKNKAKKKFDDKYKKEKEKAESWVVFCDFHEITHIVIKDATVTIYRQDNKRMVRTLPCFPDARENGVLSSLIVIYNQSNSSRCMM